ncbi:hypothetical protein D3C71_1220040 [compost metagenome]
MITAIKFDDLITFRIASSQTDSRHYSLGSRTDKANFFNKSIVFDNQLSQLVLQRSRSAKT